MSFANPTSPAKWFLYSGIFIRWLCLTLLLTNILDDYFEWVPWDIYEFTLSALLYVIIPASTLTTFEVIWIYFQRKTDGGNIKRHDMNQLAVRYFLAFIFYSYGIAKLIDHQFGVQYQTLDRSLGEINGYSLSWRFFDYSLKYKIFIGLGQVLASTLFLFRKTTTLAAIILLPIISNIVFINFAYGVPVTFYSFCYLVFTVFILLCDFDRLYAFFVSNQPLPANSSLEIARYSFLNKITFKIVKAVFIVAVIALPISNYFRYASDRNINKAFTGSYKVTGFVLANNADCADSIRWEKVFVEKWSGYGSYKTAVGKRIYFTNMKFDEKNQRLKISFWDSIHFKPINAVFRNEGDTSITINGLWGNDSIQLNMKRYLR